MKKCPKCGKQYQDTTTLCPADGAVLAKTDDSLVGQTLADKYRVEERISEGGMGTVYRGTHILMDKTVAIKVLHPALAADDVIVARFSREARAASRISHPHALNVTDFGESENGVVFLIMEYLRGLTLKEVVQNEAPMPLPRVVEIVRQVSGALEAAHAEGVVHRDLKSDNIMLVEVGDNNADWAKVLDFGIAKIQEPVGQDPALTAPNLIIGTPQYMSPEQCSQASEIDSRSDIYSLGVILYEMLVGHVPFTGESPTAIMMKHLQDAPPSVLEERKDLPAEVGVVVARALAKKPEDRFKSASELAQSLALAAEGEAVKSSASAAAAAATAQDVPDRDTNRIVVTTGPNEPPRGTSDEDYDESTIVQGRKEPSSAYETQAMRPETAQPPPPESFNPWRIIVPALVGLIVVFGVIYALTRNSAQPSSNQSNTPLVVDPGSQAVQPQPPPTGQSEQNINSSAPATTATTGTAANTSGTSGTNQNRNSDDTSANENANNANRGNKNQQNENTENQNGTEPDNSNKNSNEDTRPVDDTLPPADDDAPPPISTPTPRRRRPPKPVDTPPNPAPQESPSGASGLTPRM
jgi:eukaryotic-like serine/threonine-protein kinase